MKADIHYEVYIDEDCDVDKEITLEAVFDYDPGEDQTWDDPGYSATIDVTELNVIEDFSLAGRKIKAGTNLRDTDLYELVAYPVFINQEGFLKDVEERLWDFIIDEKG
jgi:hypothetical protein